MKYHGISMEYLQNTRVFEVSHEYPDLNISEYPHKVKARILMNTHKY